MRLASILLVIIGGLALAALPLTAATLLVAGATVMIAALLQPQVGLYLLAFSIPFGSLRPLPLGGVSLTASDVLVALLGAAWLARGVARRQVHVAHAPLILPLLLFLCAQALSLFDALSLAAAMTEMVKWAEILVVYVVASSILSEEAQARGYECIPASPRLGVLLSLLLLAALLQAALGVYQFLLGVGPEWFLIGRFMRAYGTFNQPNPYAGYLNHALPLGYALLLAGNHRHACTRLKDTALIMWLIVVGAAFLMSFSRGAWLGFAAAFVVINLLYSRRTAMAMAVVGVLVAALLVLGSVNLLPAAFTERFTSVGEYFRVFDVRGVKVTDANFAVVERMAHWQAAWGMFNDRPWLGYGIGNYEVAYPRYALAGWKEPLGHAHNVPLNLAAETGIIGLAAYLVFVAAALWTCVHSARDGDFARAIALGVLGVLIAKLGHEMLDNLWVHGMGLQVAMLLAMVHAVAARRAVGKDPPT